MLRFLLKLTLFLSALLSLAIGLIRAQPYDDGGMRDFLFNSPGCEDYTDEPCFMGIRPGVTTVDEAVSIFQRHEWVASVVVMSDYRIKWEWSGRQPQAFTGSYDGHLQTGNETRIVESIWLTLDTSLSASRLALGLPDIIAYPLVAHPDTGAYDTYYLDLHTALQLHPYADCPTSYAELLDINMLEVGWYVRDILLQPHRDAAQIRWRCNGV